MSTYAAVLTTGTWDPFVEKQFARARANVHAGDMFIIADETHGPLHIPDAYRPVAIKEGDIEALGLQELYDQTLFCHNADYYYIAFYDAHPRYDYYVFFDYPVLINTDVDALIGRATVDGVGLIAEPVNVPLTDWVYTKPHESVYPAETIRGTFLPLVVLSNAALLCLRQRRIQLSRRYAQRPDFFWPFCEAFVPTELELAGFKAAALADYGSVDQFRWWPPVLDGTLPAGAASGFVHPLLDRERYFATMLRHTRSRALFSRATRDMLSQHLSFAGYARRLLAEILKRLSRAAVLLLPLARRKSALLWQAPARAEPLS